MGKHGKSNVSEKSEGGGGGGGDEDSRGGEVVTKSIDVTMG